VIYHRFLPEEQMYRYHTAILFLGIALFLIMGSTAVIVRIVM
jgi:hypothetical protein